MRQAAGGIGGAKEDKEGGCVCHKTTACGLTLLELTVVLGVE